MKTLSIFFLGFYQLFISPFLHSFFGFSYSCRYSPTCSEYAKEQIREKGVFRGLLHAATRLASCQPFAKLIEDRV